MARTLRRLATVALATSVLSVGLGAAPASAGDESSLVNKVNSARKANGKAPLQVYWDLTDDARAHSKRMRDKGELFHNPNLGRVTTGWKALGENVGVGPNIDLLFDAFMGSSAHRSNILGGYNYIGLGVATDDGKVWVTIIFMLGPDDLLDPDPTTTTTTTTTTLHRRPPPRSPRRLRRRPSPRRLRRRLVRRRPPRRRPCLPRRPRATPSWSFPRSSPPSASIG